MVEERLMIMRTFWMRMEYIRRIFWHNFYIRRPWEITVHENSCVKQIKKASKPEPSRPLMEMTMRPKRKLKIQFLTRGSYDIPKCSFRREKSIGTKIRLLRPMVEKILMIKRTFWMRMEYIRYLFWHNFYIRRPREKNRTWKLMSWADEKSTSKPESWWRCYLGSKKTPRINLCVMGPYHIQNLLVDETNIWYKN